MSLPDGLAETSSSKRRRRRRHAGLLLPAVLLLGLLIPVDPVIPVAGATAADWNPKRFWHSPWSASGVHKGIDIFARAGTPVLAATPGLVLMSGSFGSGGNVVAILGPQARVHYYAHLASLGVSSGDWLAGGRPIGTVGTTGNAVGKPPHLHYAVVTLVPYPWHAVAAVRGVPQGWKQIFYLDPGALLTATGD
jgi:murein DD-endopeptidase MepM/ murein hydrolase activator NlpD